MALDVLLKISQFILISLEVLLLQVRIFTFVVFELVGLHCLARFKTVEFSFDKFELLFIGPFIYPDQVIDEFR
jgi:hypothetical protein